LLLVEAVAVNLTKVAVVVLVDTGLQRFLLVLQHRTQ
jgi:hypothetical protein